MKNKGIINIINFEKIVTNLFGAFDPKGDTKLLKSEASFGLRYAILVKKTWLRLLPTLFTILLLLGIAGINIYLLKFQFSGECMFLMLYIL